MVYGAAEGSICRKTTAKDLCFLEQDKIQRALNFNNRLLMDTVHVRRVSRKLKGFYLVELPKAEASIK